MMRCPPALLEMAVGSWGWSWLILALVPWALLDLGFSLYLS